MEQSIAIKAKILVTDNKIKQAFALEMEQYRQACNYVSKYIFAHELPNPNQFEVQKYLYSDLRTKFSLKSQMAISAIRTVIARYKTVNTQLRKKPYRYDTGKKDNEGKAIWKSIPRDTSWLWYPINFRRPQIDLQRGRDWSFVNGTGKYKGQKVLSINTLAKRVKVPFICRGFDQYFKNKDEYQFGALKLLSFKHNWYAHITIKKELPDYQRQNTQHVVGIDRGLRFLATCYDEKGKTLFFDGKKAVRIRRKYKLLRAKLQSKGTSSARYRLKRIGQRENRWMSDINHQISKALVDRYGSNTLFALEDLTGIRWATEKSAKQNRYEMVSWPFYDLEQKLGYKANLAGSSVVKLPPQFTSQRCPKCGEIKKTNRNHKLHLYVCDKCGYSTNDDRLAAMNIQSLGTIYRSFGFVPSFKKPEGQPKKRHRKNKRD